MHNNQNSRINGYNKQPSSSSWNFNGRNDRHDRWHEETEWSAKDETWRGTPQGGSVPPPGDRNDSWKDPPPRDFNFQLGRDRAPMPVDDQFLVRYGAKRLNNGNLVDRDGYTLRIRDPDCRAPSPPTFNPGREMRRNGDGIQNGGGGPNHSRPLDRMSQDDLDKKARQQIEMMKRMEEENKKKEKQGRGGKVRSEDEQDEFDEVEGQDEYEEVLEPPPAKETKKEIITPFGTIKSPLLPNPSPFQAAKPSTRPPYNGPVLGSAAKSKYPPRPDNWFEQYKKSVENFKEQLYRAPPITAASCSSSSSPGYFFRSNDPPSSSSQHQYPHHPTPSSRSTPSGASPAIHNPSSSTSSPYYSAPSVAPKPYRQLDLPPPGVVEFDSAYSKRSPRYTGGAEHGIGVSSVASPYSTAANAFGVFSGNAPPPPSTHLPAASSTSNRPKSPSSDSESEDEAIQKLREIIRNHGSRS